MKLLKESKQIIDYILPNYEKCLLKQYNNSTYNNKMSNLLYILYDDISNANKSFNINKNKFNIKFKKNFDIPKFSSLYMALHIKEYVINNGIYQLNYKFFINNRNININIMFYDNNDLLNIEKYNIWFYNMYRVLYICSLYSTSECSKELNIYLFPTHYKKELPKNNSIIGPDNVNTAYTNRCQPNGEIIIYRKQEWFKVFIHESIHSFGLDINNNINEKINKQLENIFSLNINFSISEAYTETWARIINVAVSLFSNVKIDKNTFIKQMIFFLQLEKIFAIIQMNKILKYMNLNYNFINNKNKNNIIICNNLYKQKTHVFGYYILPCIFLNKSMEFMNFCYKNNMSFLKFNQTDNNAKEFVNLIKETYKAKMLIECDKTFKDLKKNNFIKNTMRMSVLEIL